MLRLCIQCGTPVSPATPNSQFCAVCSAPLAPAGQGLLPPPAALVAARRIALPLGAVALAGVFAWGYFSTRVAPSTVVESKLESLWRDIADVEAQLERERKNLGDAKARLSAETAKADEQAAALKAFLATDERLADVKDTTAEVEELIKTVKDQEQEERDRKDREQAARQKRRVEDKETSDKLSSFRNAVVTVFSSDAPVATGLLLGTNGRTSYVVTASNAAPARARLACVLRTGGRTASDAFISGVALPVMRDKGTGIVLLACTPEQNAGGTPLDLATMCAAVPPTGDQIFALGTQVIGNTAFDDNVFDGTVSAAPRAGTADAPPTFQTTLPANQGSIGSPIMDGKGKLVGILVAAAPGLERTSLAVPATALVGAFARMLEEVKRGTGSGDVSYSAPMNDPLLIEAAGKSIALPYAREFSCDLGSDIKDTVLFAGPGETVVAWDRKANMLRGFAPGRVARVWEARLQSDAVVAYSPWAKNALVTNGITTGLTNELDLATGRPARRIPQIVALDDSDMARPWAVHDIGSYRVLALPDGIAIFNPRSAKGMSFRLGIMLMGRNEDLFTFTTPGGSIGWFTQSGFLPILGRIGSTIDQGDRIISGGGSIGQKRAAIGQLITRINTLAAELRTGLKLFTTKGIARDMLDPAGSFSHVPGSYTHILGRTVWQIGPADVIRDGVFTPVRHHAGNEAWFHAYYKANSMPCALASPDGTLAVTETHVYDLKTLRPAAELPFPTGPAGFVSTGTYVYAYDRLYNRIVFVNVAALLDGSGDGVRAER